MREKLKAFIAWLLTATIALAVCIGLLLLYIFIYSVVAWLASKGLWPGIPAWHD